MRHNRFLTAVTAVMLSCALMACGGQSGQQQTTTAATEGTVAAAEETKAAEEAAKDAETVAAQSPSEDAAPSEPQAAEAQTGPVTVTDMLGREITLEEPAARSWR